MELNLRISATPLALVGLALPGSVLAQNVGAPVDDEIIVTAQKRDQNIQDVRIAITAFDQEDLDRLGVQQFDDLADFVPGLEVQEQSANNPGFNIRGITSDSGEATIEPRVAIFQNGIPISRSRGSFVEVFDTDVEKAPSIFPWERWRPYASPDVIKNATAISIISSRKT